MATYKKITKIVIPILIVLFILAAFLFWPINTDGTLVKENEKLAEGKKAFLASKPKSDSLSGKKTNIIILLADDLGKYDISLYGGKSTPFILKNLNCRIPEGKTTAIVGASGSGKTTLIKILLKYYTDYEGSLKINNKNFNDISTEKWRESVGTVLQEGYIFNDTIINNICLNKSYLDIDKYKKSVQLACIEEFIETLPYQFNTKIGNEGVGLSGGQKQRILIARAIYNSPNVIIFDEATSSLDATNEKDVISNLLDNFSNKTLIIVAHRLSTVKNANQIIVLDNGCIAEIGTHDELINRSGKYYNLVRDQLELN